MTSLAGIDPRGPRFAATIMSALLLIAFILSLIGLSTARAASFGWFAYQPLADAALIPGTGWSVATASLAERALDPGFLLLAVIALLFLWGAASPQTAPWSVIFRRFVRPHLAAPTGIEDPRPPRFAQGLSLVVVVIGLVLHLIGVPLVLPIAAGAVLVAASLNAAFRFCLGCRLYLLLQQIGIIPRTNPAH